MTKSEEYMKMLKYAHNSIDGDRLRMAQTFLDEARHIYHDLETEAGIIYETSVDTSILI